MSHELVPTAPTADLHTQMEFAEKLAAASLLPRAYQRQPANVLLAMQLGDALGIPPIQAINSIHVIEGKPTASADLIGSLVRRAGHKLRVVEEATDDGPRVTATLIRADDPEFPFVAVWDRAKSRAAKLHGKGNWQTYEGQMMRNRAITEVCRMGAGDALYGVIYTPEEIGGGSVEQVPTPAPAPRQQAAPAPSASPAELVDDQGVTLITPDQQARIGALMTQLDLDKAAMLDIASGIAGRTVAGARELSEVEAEQVIAMLDAQTAIETVDAEVVG